MHKEADEGLIDRTLLDMASMLGYDMYMNGQQFYAGEGIVTDGVDETIRNVGVLGREGMKETNNKIIDIMIHNPN